MPCLPTFGLAATFVLTCLRHGTNCLALCADLLSKNFKRVSVPRWIDKSFLLAIKTIEFTFSEKHRRIITVKSHLEDRSDECGAKNSRKVRGVTA